MENPKLLIALLVVLAYALVSRKLGRWWISMPMAMLVAGYALGPGGLGVVVENPLGEVVRTVAEATLALMLFHDAVRIDLVALRKSRRIPVRLLGIGLPVMILAGTAVALGLMPALGIVGAALIATMLAPTDAALGEAVVSDKRLPVAIRQGLNVESGLNDGLSVPIFLVLLAIAADPGGWQTGALLAEIVRQIGYGLLAGLVVGGGGGLLFRTARSRSSIGRAWQPIGVLVIALSCFISAAALGGSGFIGAFAGGVIFGVASGARDAETNGLTGSVGTILDALSFLLFGAALLPFLLPFLTWQAVVYAVLSLVVLRTLSVAVATLGTGARWQTVAFMGWFGPRGLATVVFTVLLLDEAIPNGDFIAATAAICIALSVVAHGLTAPPLVSAYSRWWESAVGSRAESLEGAGASEHPGPASMLH